jgi:hypothetical protein
MIVKYAKGKVGGEENKKDWGMSKERVGGQKGKWKKRGKGEENTGKRRERERGEVNGKVKGREWGMGREGGKNQGRIKQGGERKISLRERERKREGGKEGRGE